MAAAAAQQASGLEFSPSDPPAKTGSTQIQLSALALEQANGVVACAYKCGANNDQLPPMASAYATLNARDTKAILATVKCLGSRPTTSRRAEMVADH